MCSREGECASGLSVNYRSVPMILEEVERAIEPVMEACAGVQPAFQPLVASEDEPRPRDPSPARAFWIQRIPERSSTGCRRSGTIRGERAATQSTRPRRTSSRRQRWPSDLRTLHDERGRRLEGHRRSVPQSYGLGGLSGGAPRAGVPHASRAIATTTGGARSSTPRRWFAAWSTPTIMSHCSPGCAARRSASPTPP